MFVSRDYAKTTQSIFTKFGKRVAHRLCKKATDFGGNPDNITLASNVFLLNSVYSMKVMYFL